MKQFQLKRKAVYCQRTHLYVLDSLELMTTVRDSQILLKSLDIEYLSNTLIQPVGDKDHTVQIHE